MYRLLKLLCLVWFLHLSIPLFAQTQSPTPETKSISMGYFTSIDPNSPGKEEEINKTLQQYLKQELETKGYKIDFKKGSLSDNLSNSKKENHFIQIEGNFQIQNNISLYAQIYNPKTGLMIDAYNLTDDLSDIEGLTLDKDEIQFDRDQTIKDFAKKLAIRIRSNPNLLVRHQNIQEYVQSSPIYRVKSLPISQDTSDTGTIDAFKILAEQSQSISVASNLFKEADKQPVSVTIINRKQIS